MLLFGKEVFFNPSSFILTLHPWNVVQVKLSKKSNVKLKLHPWAELGKYLPLTMVTF